MCLSRLNCPTAKKLDNVTQGAIDDSVKNSRVMMINVALANEIIADEKGSNAASLLRLGKGCSTLLRYCLALLDAIGISWLKPLK